MPDEQESHPKELYSMKCPKCGSDLTHFEMSGVNLDRCETCGGIWFDKGEVEDLLEEHWNVMKKVMSSFSEPKS